jgi:hypothetical protein
MFSVKVKSREGWLLGFVVCGAEFVILWQWLNWDMGMRLYWKGMYYVFLEKAPFLAFFGLASLAMVAPLDGVAHGRHGGRISVRS